MQQVWTIFDLSTVCFIVNITINWDWPNHTVILLQTTPIDKSLANLDKRTLHQQDFLWIQINLWCFGYSREGLTDMLIDVISKIKGPKDLFEFCDCGILNYFWIIALKCLGGSFYTLHMLLSGIHQPLWIPGQLFWCMMAFTRLIFSNACGTSKWIIVMGWYGVFMWKYVFFFFIHEGRCQDSTFKNFIES